MISPYEFLNISLDKILNFEAKRNFSLLNAFAKIENEKIFGKNNYQIINTYNQCVHSANNYWKKKVLLHPLTTWWCQRVAYLYACIENKKTFLIDYDPVVSKQNLPDDLILQFFRIIYPIAKSYNNLNLPAFRNFIHLPLLNINLEIKLEKFWNSVQVPNFLDNENECTYNADDFIINHLLIQSITFPNNIKAAPISLGSKNFEDAKKTLENTMSLLNEIWPELHIEVNRYLRSVVFVRDPSQSGNGNLSISSSTRDLSGLILISNSSPDLMIKSVVHEISHNILYSHMEIENFLDQRLSEECIFYSPWRPDIRPAIGVIHACFVFLYVAKMYLKLFELKKDQRYQTKSLKNIKKILFAIDPIIEKVSWNEKGKIFINKIKSKSSDMLKYFNEDLKKIMDQEILDDYNDWKKKQK